MHGAGGGHRPALEQQLPLEERQGQLSIGQLPHAHLTMLGMFGYLLSQRLASHVLGWKLPNGTSDASLRPCTFGLAIREYGVE